MYKDLEEGTSSQFIQGPGERKPNLVCLYKDLEKGNPNLVCIYKDLEKKNPNRKPLQNQHG